MADRTAEDDRGESRSRRTAAEDGRDRQPDRGTRGNGTPGLGASLSRRTVLGGLSALAAGSLAAGPSSATKTDVPQPTVEGPIEGGSRTGGPQIAAPHDFEAYGYVEEEFFVSGEARHDDFFADGENADQTAPYKTRVLVYRPESRLRFNGSVYAEWLNVSTQVDAPVAWPNAFDSLMRNGTAVALVSAQKVGVDDSALGLDLVTWDPQRYGSLTHPGDAFALDIFAQAVQAVRGRAEAGPDPMARLDVDHPLATGHSQSAFFLLRYINLVAPEYGIVDGFVPAGSPLTTARADLEPILWLNSEDEAGTLGDFGDNAGDLGQIDIPTTGLRLDEITVGPRDDEGFFKLWEVAGASHVNNWLSRWSDAVRRRDFQGLEADFDPTTAAQYGELPGANFGQCGFNYFPARYAWRAALEELREWATRRDEPAPAERIERTTTSEGSITIERDRFGNAKGGLRLPPIDVPVATYDAASCGLVGRTVRFDEATLDELYPTHDAYVKAIKVASADAVGDGHFRPRDAGFLIERARDSPVGE